MRPLVNPELRIRSFIYPVDKIVASIAAKKAVSGEALDSPLVLALLPQSWSSKVVGLSGLSLRLLDRARKGDLSYSQLIAGMMTEEQRQSPQEIASFIQLFQTLHNEKIFIGCIPSSYQEHSWAGYSKAVAEQEPHKTITIALENFAKAGLGPGFAIDLGCGSGRDAKQMLRQGWQVLAVDNSRDALDVLENSANGWNPEQLSTYLGLMQDAALPAADLINAGISLPFCSPDKFDGLWKNVCLALKSGGRFSGHFFGIHDDWSSSKSMTFHSADQIKRIFAGFELEHYNEIEGPIPMVPSGTRHGHIFEVVARKL